MSLEITQITSHSWFQSLDFTDPSDGQVFVMNAPNPASSVLEAASKVFRQPSPISHYSETASREFCCSLISNKHFSYRICSWNRDKGIIEELPYDKHDEFWLGCSFEIAHSEFLKTGAKTAEKFKELKLNLNGHFNFSYEGSIVSPDIRRPSYFLELLTGDDALSSSIILEKLLHAEYLNHWIATLPTDKKVLKEIYRFIHTNQSEITERLKAHPTIDIDLRPKHKSSPKSVVLKLQNHRVEGIITYKDEAFGLTNFASYFLKKIRRPEACEKVFSVFNAKKALFEVFHPEFEFKREGALYRAFEKGQFTPFQKVVETLAESHQSLPTAYVDKIILTYLSTVNLVHASGVELGHIDLDMLYINPASSFFEKKLLIVKGFDKAVDSTKDQMALGLLCYNLWVLYKMKGEVTFYDHSDAEDPRTVARVTAEVQEMIPTAATPLIKERLKFIILLLKGEVSVKDAFIVYQLYYNEIYLKVPRGAMLQIFGEERASIMSRLGMAVPPVAFGSVSHACGGAGSSADGK